MILEILQYGDPILRAKGERIEKIDQQIRELARNMIACVLIRQNTDATAGA